MAEFESLFFSTWDDFPWNGPATDWLNPLSLGTMSASAYIENFA